MRPQGREGSVRRSWPPPFGNLGPNATFPCRMNIHPAYFKERLEPMIDGEQIQLIGEVNDRAKEDFLADAAALLFPIDWPEPFGLVMIEAMACGTPIIAFRRGSVPEVIDDGKTGFIVENEAGALEAIKRLKDLDRRGVRNVFERRFTSRRMAQDYLRHYQGLVDNGNTEANSIRPRPELSSGRAGSEKRK